MILFLILQNFILWIIITTIINSYLMTFPIPVLRTTKYPTTYTISTNNRIDFQRNAECAAFSTAYILRHFGQEADGEELYKLFPSKTRSGTVYPKGIRTVLKEKGYHTKYYKGTIDTLKYEVSKGTPVIVFIKAQRGDSHLHFVPVIGYDEENIYIAESIKHLANVQGQQNRYNRKVPISDFKKMWNTRKIFMPYYRNTYITVENPKEEL